VFASIGVWPPWRIQIFCLNSQSVCKKTYRYATLTERHCNGCARIIHKCMSVIVTIEEVSFRDAQLAHADKLSFIPLEAMNS
jgi:hypothetical protein